MGTDQWPRTQVIRFATLDPIPGKGFSPARMRTPTAVDPPNSTGELAVAGTRWWISLGAF
jgi:hypothetical protein